MEVKSRALPYILSALSHGLDQGAWPRLVGGCVRDYLLGLSPSDIDLATPLVPSEVTGRLQGAAKVIPTGATFGTVTVAMSGEVFEITTLRRDVECYGRHAKVQFTKSFEEDAQRRDFTINALSYCPFAKKVYDYFGGMKHLEEGKVIFIGDPASRIREDYLRIMRFFRFSSNYCRGDIEEQGYLSCMKLREGLKMVAAERIKCELDKIVVSKRAGYFLRKMLECGLFELLLPSIELDLNLLPQIVSLFPNCSLELRYAAFLCRNDPSVVASILKERRFPNSFVRNTLAVSQFFHLSGPAEECLKLALSTKPWKVDECVAALGCSRGWNQAEISRHIALLAGTDSFPVRGGDLVGLGYKGKEVGEKLRELKEKWAKGTSSKAQLLNSLGQS